MKAPPSLIVGILLLWSAALVSARVVGDDQSGGGANSFTGATIIYTSNNLGTLYLPDGSATPYTGSEILGTDQVAVYNNFNGTLTSLGTLKRVAGVPLALAGDPTASNGVLTLPTGSNFVTGGTLNLGASSSLTFDGQVNSGGTIAINPGATLLTSGVSTINSGLTVQLGNASTLTTSGILTLGAGSIINSDATISPGADATITNGALTFGTGGTITSNATLTLGPGSVLANNLDLTSSGGVTLTGGLILSGTSTLTVNGFTTGGVSIISMAPGGVPGLLTGPLTVTGNLVFTSATTLGITANVANFTGPFTVTASTPLNFNLASGLLLNRLPTIQGSALTTGGTAIKFLDGVLTGGGSISLLYLPAVQNLASDPISIHISEYDTPGVHDKYVLQLSYDPTTAAALGDALDLYLGWFDLSDSTWKNAVYGDSDGGASAHFVVGAYDSTTDFNLGWYGVNTANNTVWAVVDHNSEFGVAEPTPEPSTGALLICGLALLGRRSRKQ